MRSPILLLVASALSVFVTVVSAMPLVPAVYPPSLLYLRMPIDPLCFFNMPEKNEAVHFDSCGIHQSRYEVTRIDTTLTKKLFYGYEWGNKAITYPAGGYSYYQAWNAGGGKYWIYTINSSGGSGDFTAIHLFSRKNEQVGLIKTVQGGDRCNGGLSDVLQRGYDLEYAVNLTAYDVLAVSGMHSQLKAYDDLAACAACCAAKAYYQVDLRMKPKLLYVDFGRNEKISEMATQGKLQACFNSLFVKYVRQGKSKLNSAELGRFAKEFQGECVK